MIDLNVIPQVVQITVPHVDISALQVVLPPVSRSRGGDWYAGNFTIEDGSIDEIVQGIGAHLAVYYAKQREAAKEVEVARMMEKAFINRPPGSVQLGYWLESAKEVIKLIKSED